MGPPPEPSPLAKLRHDLRTPINHILGYSELLEEELADRGVGGLEDLARIRAAARTLLDLIATGLADSPASAQGLAGTDAGAPASRGAAALAAGAAVEPGADPSPERGDRPAPLTGRILVVDDDAENRETLTRRLRRQGHETAEAANGREALEELARSRFDLVLLDVLMPEMDGYATLGRLKNDPALGHIPVIMVSALGELESVVRCIEAGAVDYLPKPFNPTLLRARIGACLEKKALRDQERAHLHTIEETQKRLDAELQEAARYVASILPPPMETPFRIRWAYEPSTELGGDSFGYHWIDDTHFAIYLLDVCGHGVGAALLSVSALGVIRSGALPETEFRDPAQVLARLNEAFQMERHNEMYFTIWYGVFDTRTRTLACALGGHPPAVLLRPAADGSDEIVQLGRHGLIIGAVAEASYSTETISIPERSRLFVLSDGAFEIDRPDGSMLAFREEFLPFLLENGRREAIGPTLLAWIRSVHGERKLDDDCSFLAIDFPA